MGPEFETVGNAVGTIVAWLINWLLGLMPIIM